jgi:glycosyltransferase involved in cell wall biosynthesis
MKLGVANLETWIFLQDIYEYLSKQYPTQVFEPAKLPENWLRGPLGFAQGKAAHWLLRRSLDDFIRAHDVVFFEWASALLVEATDLRARAVQAKGHPAQLVTRLHRYELFEWFDRVRWEQVAYAILDTQAMRRKLLDRTGLPAERAVVIPPVGLPAGRILATVEDPQDDRPFAGRIGILANLTPRKRIYELILAFAALSRHDTRLELHIGGSHRRDQLAYYEAIQFLVDKLGLKDKVQFYGRVNERWDWYRQMDVFVSFSFSEGMQVAPLEAAASGCYCVSHWWEGAEEIFPVEDVFVTEAEFVERVLAYANADPARRREMRQPLLRFVREDCDIQKINRQIQQIIEQAHADARL